MGAGSTLSFTAGSTIGLEWDATTSNKIKALGAATIGTGAGVTLAMSGTYSSGTTYTVLEAGSGLGTGVYNLLNVTDATVVINKSATSVTLTPTTATPLTTAYWKGGYTGSVKMWSISDGSTSSNWGADLAGTATSLIPSSGTTINFSATGALTANKTAMTLGANMSVAGIVISDVDPIGLSADLSTLTLGTGGITVNSGSGTVTLAVPLSLSGAQSWTNDSVNLLTISGNVSNGSNLLTVGGTTNTTISGVIGSGSGGVSKSGIGTLTLSGPNTYTGATSVSAGTLSISNTATFTNTSAINLSGTGRLDVNVANQSLAKLSTGGGGTGVVAGTFLRYSQNQSTAGASNGPGTIFGTIELNAGTVSPNYTLNFGAGSTLKNLISSSYGSALTLSGTGTTTFEAGISTLAVTGAVSGADSGTKTLLLTGAGNGTLGGPGLITNGSGTVNLVKEGLGRWDINSEPGHAAGTILVKQGILELRVDNTNGFSASSFTSVTLGDPTLSNTNAATLRINGGGNPGSAIPIIVGAGSSGTLTIERYNGASGTTGFSGGITLANNVRLYGSNGSVNVESVGISGSGNVTTDGSVVLSAANTFTGSVTVSSGTLSLGNTNANVTGWTINGGRINMGVSNAWGTADMTFADTTRFGMSAAGSYTASNQMTLSGTVTHTVNNGYNMTLSGLITGSGALAYVGTNIEGNTTLTLSKSTGNDFSGGLTIKSTGVASANKNRGTLTVDATAANVLGSGVVTFAGDATGPTPSTPIYRVVAKLTASQMIAGLEGTPNTDHTYAVRGGNATVRTLTLNGASGTNTFGGIIGGTGTNENKIELTKSGGSTQILTGVNTYIGNTTISGGTLALGAVGSIASSPTVDIKDGAIFDTVAQSFTMSGAQSFKFTINPSGSGTAGKINAAALDISTAVVDFATTGTLNDPAYIIATYTSKTGAAFATPTNIPSGYVLDYAYGGGNVIALKSTGGLSPYDQWALDKGLTGLNNAADLDPDNDGANNLSEFAFNGDPLSGSNNGQVYGLTSDTDADGETALKELVLTLAVRKTTPAFTIATAPSTATSVTDDITYSIEGSDTLSGFPLTVTPVTMVPPGVTLSDTTNYEYRSFRLDGSNGLPTKGFLRAKVTKP